jgi:hypothetical protein
VPATGLHVGHGHFLQVGDVFLEVLECVFDLQRKQAAQASAVFGGGHFGLVKHFNGHSVAPVNEGRKANEGLHASLVFLLISSSSGSSPNVQAV